MTGLFAAALAGWLCLFLLVLAAAAARRRAPWAALPPRPGAEPPAVIGLLARSRRTTISGGTAPQPIRMISQPFRPRRGPAWHARPPPSGSGTGWPG